MTFAWRLFEKALLSYHCSATKDWLITGGVVEVCNCQVTEVQKLIPPRNILRLETTCKR
jgi:hypothetical protein